MNKAVESPVHGRLLVLEDVRKSFRHNGNLIEILKGVDLAVHPGESLAITGASGVGKSTLLNIMGTLEPPSTGVVRFQDRIVTEMAEPDLCRLRNREIGFVFQFHHLLPEFTALENTIMPALIARLGKGAASQMAVEILAKVGLEKRLTHRVGELSGGSSSEWPSPGP